MSKIQSDRQEDIQFARKTDKVTERQNDSMADSRAAKEPALVLFIYSKLQSSDGDKHVGMSIHSSSPQRYWYFPWKGALLKQCP